MKVEHDGVSYVTLYFHALHKFHCSYSSSTKLNCACLEKRRLSMPLFLTRFIKFLAFNGYQYPPISNIRNGQLCFQPQIVMIQTAWIWLSLDEADKISWANHNFLDNLTNLLSRYMYTVRSSCTFSNLFTMTIMALKLRSFIQSIEQLISFMHLRYLYFVRPNFGGLVLGCIESDLADEGPFCSIFHALDVLHTLAPF